MQLRLPFMITPRLEPGVRIAGGWISIKSAGSTKDNRPRCAYIIDTADSLEYFNHDLHGAAGAPHDLQEGMQALLSFLGAAAEAYSYSMRTGRKSENGDLFPAEICEWAAQNYGEIGMLQLELESTPGLVTDVYVREISLNK